LTEGHNFANLFELPEAFLKWGCSSAGRAHEWHS
jgi:hypothetical protein